MPELTSHGGTMATSLRHQWRDTICGGGAYGCILGPFRGGVLHQRLMEAHLAPKSSVQVKKIASSCVICSGPHDTQYCMENPEQAFVDYASSRADEAGGKWFTFKPEKNNLDARLSKFEADFKQQQSEMTNKIDTFLKAINDRMTRPLPSDTVKNLKLNVNSTSSVLSARSCPLEDPQCSSHIHNSINAIKICSIQTNESQKDQSKVKTLTVNEIGTPRSKEPELNLEDEFKDLHLNLLVLEVLAHAPILGDSKPFDTLADLGSCVNLIPLYLFKKLKIRLLKENDHVFGLADGTKSYPVEIVKNVEVHIGRLKLLEDFYVIDMEKDPATPLLVGIGFLATASAVIYCRKAKITVGEGVTRSVFGVKEIDLGGEEVPYWTTLGKRQSYGPRPSTDGIGAQPRFYARKDFLDYHFLEE
ncbi:MAK10-like protein [Tanacetum coccineum]